jgi:type II secretory pathway component GspD/PulD (secretin)
MDPPANPEDWFQGRVSSGSSIPYESVAAFGGTHLASTTQYRDTGVTLECSAQDIKYSEFINLKVKVAITDLTGFINIGANAKNDPLRAPVLDNRNIEAEIVVRDRSVFIAGLLKASREIERRQGVPWLSELPVLGLFLSNKRTDIETTELVFLVRPEILTPLRGAL